MIVNSIKENNDANDLETFEDTMLLPGLSIE